MERVFFDRDKWLPDLKSNPAFDALRSDPRFADLERRLGLPVDSGPRAFDGEAKRLDQETDRFDFTLRC